MESKTIKITYKITPKVNSWEYDKITSNIADDPVVEWRISKSLSDELVKKSATLAPEQLLVQYAEIQKRDLEMSIEGLNDLELVLKAKTETIRETLQKIIDNQSEIWNDKSEIISNKTSEIAKKIQNQMNIIKPIDDQLYSIATKIDDINIFGLKDYVDTLLKIQAVYEKHPELLKINI